MSGFWTGLLWGVIVSIVGVPLIILFYHIIKKTIERRKIKRMINRKEFLVPIDEKDYDAKAWGEDIAPMSNKDERDKLNKMFVKPEEVNYDKVE